MNDQAYNRIKEDLTHNLEPFLGSILKRFKVTLGIRMSNTSIVLCAKENGKDVFGTDVDIHNKSLWDKNNGSLVINYGCSGSFDPAALSNGAFTAMLVGTIMFNWAEIKPILDKAFEDYVESYPRH